MNEYSFFLSLNGGTESEVHPIWGDGLSLVFSKENNQEFFRRTLNAPIVFIGSEFSTIESANIETEFGIRIERAGATYWTGVFYKTDCTLDYDAKTASVTPKVKDGYNEILAALDKEFNFTDLACEQDVVKYDIRPKVQLYATMQSKCTCLIGNTIFEQECTKFNAGFTAYDTLINTHHFIPLVVGVYMSFNDSGFFTGMKFYGSVTLTNGRGTADIIAEGYNSQMSIYPFARVRVYQSPFGDTGPIACDIYTYDHGEIRQVYFGEYNESGYWVFRRSGDPSVYYYPEGTATMVFACLLLAKDSIGGQTAFPIDAGFSQEVNYTHCIDYGLLQPIIGVGLQDTPSEYGLYKDGKYYSGFPSPFGAYRPICQSAWGRYSIWYPYSFLSDNIDQDGRTQMQIKGNTLVGVINALFDKTGVSLTFDATENSSRFLFGTNRPVLGIPLWLFFVEKKDILYPNSKPLDEENKISLKNIFEFLRDAFRLYWYVEDGRLKIEHIEYFNNGEDYYTQPQIGVNLLTAKSKTGKYWSYGQGTIKYDKATMPERYEFGWADDVTELFAGLPLNIKSGIIEQGRVEGVNIQKITTDLDFMLSNPSDISKSGFAVLGAFFTNNEYKVAYYGYSQDGVTTYLQNGFLAFIYLYQLYLYDLPAWEYSLGDGDTQSALGVKKGISQEVAFPSPSDPNLYKLVRTQIGDGKIEKITINLSSRGAAATIKLPTR